MKLNILKATTGIAGAYHLVLALVGLCAPTDMLIRTVDMAFGVTLAISPQLGLILKFTSVYMLAFAAMLLLVSFNPVRYRVFVFPALILFGLRFVNRVLFFGTLTSVGMSLPRNLLGTGVIFLFFVTMLLCLPKRGAED